MNKKDKVLVVARDIRRKDAVGEFALFTAELLEKIGFEAQCYSENTSDDLRSSGIVRCSSSIFDEIEADDMVLFHFSTYDPVFDKLIKLQNKLCVYFHNITPPNFFKKWDEHAVLVTRQGYNQLKHISKADYVATNSPFSAEMLKNTKNDLNNNITVIAPTKDLSSWKGEVPNKSHYSSLRFLLYVGRLAPNKGIEQLIDIYSRVLIHDLSLHLIIVGTPFSPSYEDFLKEKVKSLGLDIEKVQFLAGVKKDTLADLYHNAQSFVTLSAHEGFCVPVAESLYFECPVFARNLPPIEWICSHARRISFLHDVSCIDTAANDLLEFLKKTESVKRNPFKGVNAKKIEKLCNAEALKSWLSRSFKN